MEKLETTEKTKETDSPDECSESERIREKDFPNQDLEGKKHPKSGVPYERKEFPLPDGSKIERVFPVFESKFKGDLPSELHKSSDPEQFKYMNDQLKAAIEKDPKLAEQFSEKQLEQIRNGEKPEGYTWHHAEDPPGRMELVKTEDHMKSGHVGGKAIWGGGTDNRKGES